MIVIGLDLVPVEISKPRYSAQTRCEIVRLLTPALNDTAIRWNGYSFQSTDWMLSDTAMRALIRWDPERFQRPAKSKKGIRHSCEAAPWILQSGVHATGTEVRHVTLVGESAMSP